MNDLCKDLKFEIAGIGFHYIYEEEIFISKESSINHFIVDLGSYDVVNYVSFGRIKENVPLGAIKRYTTPAWTWYDFKDGVFVEFHPGNNYIACSYIYNGGSLVFTKVVDKNFQPYPLPVSITGFLLQLQLNSKKQGFIMHGATLNINGKGIVLSGNSGVGKSTLSALLQKYIHAHRITDDRLIVKHEENFGAYGNPFDKKLEECDNVKIQIDGIILLKHGKKNNILQLSSSEARRKLLTICLLPYGHEQNLYVTFEILMKIADDIPVFEFEFTPDEKAVSCLQNDLNL